MNMDIVEKRLFQYEVRLAAAEKATLEQWLQSHSPVEIEIGCGKGKFIVARSQAHPEINFIAIDRVGKWMKIGRTRSEKRNLENLIFLKTDGPEFITKIIPDNRISVFHINFPDPWPKKRHQKRRIVNRALIHLLHGKLISGGQLQLATDFENYFNFMKEEITACGINWKIRESVNQRLTEEGSVKTNYEAKYELQGKKLFYMELIKI